MVKVKLYVEGGGVRNDPEKCLSQRFSEICREIGVERKNARYCGIGQSAERV